jgi:hypothetical protein
MSEYLGEWYPIQTCPQCLKEYDPVKRLTECPVCQVDLEVREPKIDKQNKIL